MHCLFASSCCLLYLFHNFLLLFFILRSHHHERRVGFHVVRLRVLRCLHVRGFLETFSFPSLAFLSIRSFVHSFSLPLHCSPVLVSMV